MKALLFKGVEAIDYGTDVPAPLLIHPQDAIVKVSLCAICGSDLHPFWGSEQGITPGTVVGHEFVGKIAEVGAQVVGFKPGDRVCCPFTTSCGCCFFCRKGWTCRCEKGLLFGWVEDGQGLHGGQAEYVRVPLASSTLIHLPDGVTEEEALLLGDVLPTGLFCALNGNIHLSSAGQPASFSQSPQAKVLTDSREGDIGAASTTSSIDDELKVVVLGCGPVGLCAVASALHLGAKNVLAVDGVPARLALAEKFGASTLPLSSEGTVEKIITWSGGRGADVILEVVGSTAALRLAFDVARPGAIISSVGVHTATQFPFSPVEAYNKNITYKSGRCPARSLLPEALALLQSRRFPLSELFTHRLPLSQGSAAYDMFARREGGCIKIALDPTC